jgi:transposase-like protein
MVRKRYTPAQKAAIVLELLKEEDTLPAIASRHGVHPNLLRKWKAQPQCLYNGVASGACQISVWRWRTAGE